MTERPCDRADPTVPTGRPRFALPALCATQITGWGVVYYAFPVLNPYITADTGWSPTLTMGAFSAALLVSALVGIPIGRILDRHGPRAAMTAGSVLAAASVVAVASAPDFAAFAVAWLVAGVSMAAILYQPAFAAVTRWWGEERVRALTIVTLAGGLASTVFAPLTGLLAAHLSWRLTYVVLAVVLAAVTVPAHALALRGPWPPAPPARAQHLDHARAVARSRPFLLLSTALTLSAFAMFAFLVTLVPLMTSRGASPAVAALALGLGGLGQTVGRSLYGSLARRVHATARAAVLMGTSGVATAALALVRGPVPVLVVLAVVAGTVRGTLTLLQATAVTERWGVTHYAALSARLSAPVTVAIALAPFASTALAGPLGGYPHVFVLLAALSFLAAPLALGTGEPAGSRRHWWSYRRPNSV